MPHTSYKHLSYMGNTQTTHTFGDLPVVDHQGDMPVCVKAAASKAIITGLWHSKWTNSRFDAKQDFVLGLLHGDKDDKRVPTLPDFTGETLGY